MGKTRDLFKKIRDTKGTFHEKMGSVKERRRKKDKVIKIIKKIYTYMKFALKK